MLQLIINILILFYTLVDTAKSILQQSEVVANCSGKQYLVSKKVLTEESIWSYMNLGIKDSFYEYIENVYGEYPDKFADHRYIMYNLDLLYKRSFVEFRFRNELKRFGEVMDFHLSEHAFGFRANDYLRPQVDNAWVEVQRSATACIINKYIYPFGVHTPAKEAIEDTYVEGLGRGWPLDSGFDQRIPKPYGCWFYMLRGTGIYVNVGKTVVAYNRSHAFSLVGLPCSGGPHCYDPNDYEVCSKVLEKGYDSLQIFNSHDGRYSELVICSGRCSHEPVKSACPPLDLRTGWNATKLCRCNSTYPILNCNNHVTSAFDCHNFKPIEYRVKQTCYYEDFTWLNDFPSSPVKITIIFVTNNKDITYALPRLKTLMSAYKATSNVVLVDTGVITGLSRMIFSHGMSKVFDGFDRVEYDIVPLTHSYLNDEIVSSQKQYKFSLLSLTLKGYPRSTIVSKGGIKIGFISYSSHHSAVSRIVELVTDEVLCLKRWTDMIVLVSDVEPHIDHVIASKLHSYIDIIIGKPLKSNSCNNTQHLNDVFVINSPEDVPVGIVSVEVLNKTSYSLATSFIDLYQESIAPDEDIEHWIKSM